MEITVEVSLCYVPVFLKIRNKQKYVKDIFRQ